MVKKKIIAGNKARKRLYENAAARMDSAPFCIPWIKKTATSYTGIPSKPGITSFRSNFSDDFTRLLCNSCFCLLLK
jgi:hypothetical protein